MSTPNKYQPPVNMPERTPGTLMVQFLHSNGAWMGFNADAIGLCQKDDTHVSLAVQDGDKFIHLLTWTGFKLVPVEEKKVVVP